MADFVAKELLEKEELEYDEIEAIFEEYGLKDERLIESYEQKQDSNGEATDN